LYYCRQITVTIFTLLSDLTTIMKAIVTTTLSIIGGWLGWWLGDQIGLFTALLVGMIGTGIGIYAGRQLARQFD
jgi:membrane protein YqaA with SNARE-associated domain